MCDVIRRIARSIALASVLAVAAAPAAHAAQAAPGKMEVVDLREPELEFVDVVYAQKPTQDNEAEVEYRFERTRERDDTFGSVHRHAHEVALGFGRAVTDWLGFSMEIPYSLTHVQTLDPATGDQVEPDTRNLGDVAAKGLVTFYRNPDWQVALGGGLEVTLPTGSFRDGTGGNLALAPFLSLGKWFGPLQILADVGFSAQLRQQSEEEERGRELTYNVAIAYPLFEKRIIPFFEMSGVYAFAGEAAVKHRGQLYLSPGLRINPFGDVHGGDGHDHGHAHGGGGHPWWERLSLAIAPQFPVTGVREFEWGITSSLKLEF
jgi:hypothetical protein